MSSKGFCAKTLPTHAFASHQEPYMTVACLFPRVLNVPVLQHSVSHARLSFPKSHGQMWGISSLLTTDCFLSELQSVLAQFFTLEIKRAAIPTQFTYSRSMAVPVVIASANLDLCLTFLTYAA